MRRTILSVCAAAMLALVGGCTTYYMVKDPSSSKVFYTTDIDKGRNGAVTFKDAKSKAEITLQSSEISKISSDEYDKAVGSQ